MIIKFNIDVFTPQLTDLRSADLGMTSSFSVKQSKKNPVITWPNNRKLNITSCSWRVLNTDAQVDVRVSVDSQAERPVDASESPKFLNASFSAFRTSTLTGSAVLLEASVPQRRLWEQEQTAPSRRAANQQPPFMLSPASPADLTGSKWMNRKVQPWR